MTEKGALSEQIKIEADEVLFDGIHFDTRLKERVRELAKQEMGSARPQTLPRRWPWLQLSLVAAVFAVVIIGSYGAPMGMMKTQAPAAASSPAPSSTPPTTKGATDTVLVGEAANKVASNATVKSPAAPEAGMLAEKITVGGVKVEDTVFTVTTTASSLIEYQLKTELPQAPVALKTAAEAWNELRNRPLAPDQALGSTLTVTKVELMQRPSFTGQAGQGELCYLFSGSFENGAPFSQYVYAEKGKTGVPQ